MEKGAKNYIAKIVGTHEKYGMDREFLGFEVRRNLKSSEFQEFCDELKLEDGTYEIGTGYDNKYKNLIVVENGKVRPTTKNEVITRLVSNPIGA